MTEEAEILKQVKSLAARYYELTGKPLGVTGEVGEYEVAKALDLTLSEARQAGYDAIGPDGRKVQIKARVVPEGKNFVGQRVGAIRLDHEWDTVALILMTPTFEVIGIHEAARPIIEAELKKPGSKARNERGALAVSQFIRASKS
jgi:hypothetical protein